MRTLLLTLVAVFSIGFSTISIVQPVKAVHNTSIESAENSDGYTYQYLEIDGKMFVYVYLDGFLVDIYEVED